MDKKTEVELKKISAQIPQELTRNLMKKEVDTSEEDLARYALKSKTISSDKKNQIARLIEMGSFRQSEDIVNPEVAKKLDEFHSFKVKQAIKQGKLQDPKKDAWLQKRLSRM